MEEIAAAYVRTSADKDDAFSLDSQLDAIRLFAAANHIIEPSEYELREEFTGKVLDRPKLNRLRELIKDGKIKAIIIHATGRLARKVGVADILIDELFSYGVKLYIVSWGTYVRDTPEDRLRFNYEATYSDFERRKIVERTTRGKKDKLQQGIYLGTGKPPYGYRQVGRKREIHLEIVEEEAVVIRLIFHWYVIEHVAVAEIVRRLAGVPTPAERKGVNFPHRLRGAGEWADGTVRWILRNAAYTGTMTMWHSPITVPAIIDPDLYERARERMVNARPKFFHSHRYEYLMGRRLRCKFCGYSIEAHPRGDHGVITSFNYRCPSRRARLAKPKCRLPGFRVQPVDDAVWEWVRNLILHPESLRLMLEESKKELQEHTHDLKYRLTRVENRLRAEEKRLGVLIREYADSEARADTSEAAATVREVYRQTKEQSEQLFVELTQERDTLRRALAGSTIDDTLIEELFGFAQAIKEDIDSLPFSGRRELIENLEVRGELAFEDGQRVLYILWHTHAFRRVLAVSEAKVE